MKNNMSSESMDRFLCLSEQFGRASGRALGRGRAAADRWTAQARPVASAFLAVAMDQGRRKAALAGSAVLAAVTRMRPAVIAAQGRIRPWAAPAGLVAVGLAIGLAGYGVGMRSAAPEVHVVEGLALQLPSGPVMTMSVPRPVPRPASRPAPRPGEGLRVTLSEDLLCMAANIFHEARGERSERGKGMVGQVFMNRVGKPGRPSTVCGVIHQYKQASWTLDRPYVDLSRKGERMSYLEAFAIAQKVLEGRYESVTAGAHMYYNPRKVTPYWADDYIEVRVVGGHRFMK